jgi:hypothetical protein
MRIADPRKILHRRATNSKGSSYRLVKAVKRLSKSLRAAKFDPAR